MIHIKLIGRLASQDDVDVPTAVSVSSRRERDDHSVSIFVENDDAKILPSRLDGDISGLNGGSFLPNDEPSEEQCHNSKGKIKSTDNCDFGEINSEQNGSSVGENYDELVSLSSPESNSAAGSTIKTVEIDDNNEEGLQLNSWVDERNYVSIDSRSTNIMNPEDSFITSGISGNFDETPRSENMISTIKTVETDDNEGSLQLDSIAEDSNYVSMDSRSTNIKKPESDFVSITSGSSGKNDETPLQKEIQSSIVADNQDRIETLQDNNALLELVGSVEDADGTMKEKLVTVWWPELEAPKKNPTVTFAEDVEPHGVVAGESAVNIQGSSLVLPQLSSALENAGKSITSLQRELVLNKPPEWGAGVVRIYQEMKFEIRDGLTTEFIGEFSVPFEDFVSNLGEDKKSRKKLKFDIHVPRKGLYA